MQGPSSGSSPQYLAPPGPPAGFTPDNASAATPLRLLAFLVGGVTLLILIPATLGCAILMLIAVGLAAGLGARRGARQSGWGSWFVAAATGGLLFTGLVFWFLASGSTRITANGQTYTKNAPQSSATQGSRAVRRFLAAAKPTTSGGGATASSGVRPKGWWAILGAFAIGSLLIGALAGTFVWFAGMLVAFAVLGRWPFSRQLAPALAG